MAHAVDVSAVPLPPPWANGLLRLVARHLTGTPESAEANARAMLVALFGANAPTFGQVARVSADELKTACGQAGLGAAELPLARLRELAELLPRVAPSTPICDECGAFPLSSPGGKVLTLAAGSRCPLCGDGVVGIVPMRLRKLAWTDGRLVEPQTTHDVRSAAGDRLPLDDDGLLAWAGGWMDSGLETALRDEGVPAYGWVALLRLQRRLLNALTDVPLALQRPSLVGIRTAEALLESVREAGTFLAEREVTNVARRHRLACIPGDTDALRRMVIAGRTYAVEGLVGQGDRCDAYRAAWDSPFTERVIIKVSRAGGTEDARHLASEAGILQALCASKANGTPFFSRMLPSVVAQGDLLGTDGLPRRATVFRYKHQFDWTLADVMAEYPEGVDPQTMVWMWNRILLQLRWLQMSGVAHGAIVPGHVLVHPEYHAVALLSWANARFVHGRAVTAAPLHERHEPFCPAEVREGGCLTFDTDVAMSARCMIAVLGGDPGNGVISRDIPEPIALFLRCHARYGGDGLGLRFTDGEALEREFGKVTSAVYGKRRYHPFFMPRPSR